MVKRKTNAKLKTTKTEASVKKFLDKISDAKRRGDCYAILEMMKKAAKAEPKMWGTSIVGFGNYHYKYESGREGDWFPLGFSPRKQNLTLYLVGGLNPHEKLMKKLGKYSTGKGCLYINDLNDVDITILQKMLNDTIANLKATQK